MLTKGDSRRSKPKASETSTLRLIVVQTFALLRKFGNPIVAAVAVMYCFRQATIAVTAFAGQTSVASLAMRVAGFFNVTLVGSISIAGATTILWANEYRRHRKTREQLTARITKLELKIDPNRTSSLLTPQGLTPPGDF